MKIKLCLAAIAALTSTVFINNDALGVVNTVVNSNGYSMQVALVTAEPPNGPLRNQFNQNVMDWLTGPQHIHSAGYWRSDPSAILPEEQMYREWYLVFSTQPSFHLWNCATNPSGQYSNELGTMLQAPLIIGTTNADATFNPSNLWYNWSSSDFYHAFSGVGGQLSVLYGTSTIQGWSTTCIGIWGTNQYTSGPMTNRVNEIIYSGAYIGFGVTNGANEPEGSAYAVNYIVGQWPFDITITYTLMDDTGSNVVCQGSALLDSIGHLHIGNTGTNTSFVGIPCATLEAQDYIPYLINTYTNGPSQPAISWGVLEDNGVIPVGTNTCQYFVLAANELNQASSDVQPRRGSPPVTSGQ